jgi:hypothetical protein
MFEHRPTDPLPPRSLARVHGFQLALPWVELLERAHGKKHTVSARAEERDGWVEKTLDVQGMHVLRRTELERVSKVDFQEAADVVGARVVDREHETQWSVGLVDA